MAKPINICHVTATIFFFLVISQLSSARILNSVSSNNLAATELALNLALPGDSVSASSAGAPEKDSSHHALPCEMDSNKNFHTDIPAPDKLPGKYGRLVLNMLPKGPTPPSGPSHGTNNINN